MSLILIKAHNFIYPVSGNDDIPISAKVTFPNVSPSVVNFKQLQLKNFLISGIPDITISDQLTLLLNVPV